jgi:glycosyltransferase involved in cell wall biosynthesis
MGGDGRRVVALVPNVVGTTGGQRTRVERWLRYLEDAGWRTEVLAFEDERLLARLHQPGHHAAKAAGVVRCWWAQWRATRATAPADVVVIYREAALLGPALIERWAMNHHRRAIYDVDDPIFVPYRSPTNGWISLFKFAGKVPRLMARADRVTVINETIAAYARKHNDHVSVIPICVDTDALRPGDPRPDDAEPVLVWIGSHSTLQNLRSIEGALVQLARRIPFTLRVIGAGTYELPGVRVDMRQWSPDTEADDLAGGDVGLVPLLDLPWNRWKYNFKTVQYLAAGLPVVARAFGSNVEIIDDGVNGFLVETEAEWVDRLHLLLTDVGRRRDMGRRARALAVERYSLANERPLVVSVFEEVAASGDQSGPRRTRWSSRTRASKLAPR